MNPISIITGIPGGSGAVSWPAVEIPLDIDRAGNIASNKLVVSALNTTSGLFEDLITILSGAAPSVSLTAISSLTLPAMTPGGVSGIYEGTKTLIRIFQAALAAGGQSIGENVFIGNAGNSTMTNGAGITNLASYNTAIGYASFLFNTTGQYNTSIGHGALQANTTGDYNTSAVLKVRSSSGTINLTGWFIAYAVQLA